MFEAATEIIHNAPESELKQQLMRCLNDTSGKALLDLDTYLSANTPMTDLAEQELLTKVLSTVTRSLVDTASFSAPELKEITLATLIVSAAQGSAEAQFGLGNCYYKGTLVKEDLDRAFNWFQKAALNGQADAQNMVGVFFNRPLGTVAQDHKKAFQYLQQAAAQGCADAESNLGFYYRDGILAAPDHAKAFELFQKAATKGSADAQAALGAYYFNIEKNYKLAVEWSEKAVQQNVREAQYNLAVCYQKGLGIDKDFSKAVVLLEKAAKQGHSEAQASLGCHYYNGGCGLPIDFKQAAYWFEKAAQQSHPIAQCNLGVCYMFGKGVPEDQTLAWQWFRKSAAQGNDGAIHMLNQVYCHPSNTEPGASLAATVCKKLLSAVQAKKTVDPQRLQQAFTEGTPALKVAYHIIMGLEDTEMLGDLLCKHPEAMRTLFIEDPLTVLQSGSKIYEWLMHSEQDSKLWQEKTKLLKHLVRALEAAPTPDPAILSLFQGKAPKYVGGVNMAKDTQRSYGLSCQPNESNKPKKEEDKKYFLRPK